MLTTNIFENRNIGNISLIRKFMVFIGPIARSFDFLTFYVLLHFFHADQVLLHTGWFVESLATQTLVLFVIRTSQNPLRSRPSQPLMATITDDRDRKSTRLNSSHLGISYALFVLSQ